MRNSIIGLALALPATAAADDVAPESGKPGVLAGVRVGGLVPFNGLSPTLSTGVEVGYTMRRLAVVLAIDYAQPTTSNSESDPRVTGGQYTWSLTEQQLGTTLAAIYRLTSMKPVVPYGGIGPRVLFARSTVGDDGAPVFMDTKERSTRFGVAVPLGAELVAGPGRLTGELLLQYGTLDHVATGDAHTGAASLSVGYRMLF